MMNTASMPSLQSALLCNLPKGELLYSANFIQSASKQWVCTLVKLSSASGQLIGTVGGHVPQLFGSVPGQVCAKFQGLTLPSGIYQVEMTFSHGEQLRSEVEYADNLKSSSPKSLKHFATVSAAIDAMINGTNHPEASRPLVAKPVEVTVAPAAPVAPARPAIAPPPYNFYVDGVIGGVVEGWIWCPQKPENRYEVQAWCDGRLVAYGIANKFRQDLKEKGKADGNIKFELPLSRHLFDGKDHVLQIRVVGQGEPDNDRVLQAGLGFEAPNRAQRSEIQELLISYDQSILAIQKFIDRYQTENKKLDGTTHKILLGIQNGEPKIARKMILELLNELPEHPLFKFKLAECLLIERKFPEAEQAYRGLLWDYGKSEWVYAGLADSLRLQGRYEEALVAYDAALQINPTALRLQKWRDKTDKLIPQATGENPSVGKTQAADVLIPKSTEFNGSAELTPKEKLSASPAALSRDEDPAEILKKLKELTERAKSKVR